MANSKQVASIVTPGRLDADLVVLRKVDVKPLSVRVTPNAPTTMEMIGSGHVEQGLRESQLTWFKDGYVLNDQPRTSIITDEIIDATVGFAIARTDTGEILREGGKDSLGKMLGLVKGARMSLAVDVDIEPDEEMAEDLDPEATFAAEAAAQVAAEQSDQD